MTQNQLIGLGILAAFGLTWYLARRDRQSVTAAWTLLASVAASAMIAGWLFPRFIGSNGFSSLGALTGASFAVAGLRIGAGRARTRQLLDVVVPPGFLALAAARLGCLFEGCDFGAPTDGILSVEYLAPHPVWYLHVVRGLVDQADLASVGIHPFPLYICIPVAALALVAAFTIRGGRGTRAMIVALGYAIVRSVAEFFRDPATVLEAGGVPLVLPIAVVFALGVVVWWRESNHAVDRELDSAQSFAADRR